LRRKESERRDTYKFLTAVRNKRLVKKKSLRAQMNESSNGGHKKRPLEWSLTFSTRNRKTPFSTEWVAPTVFGQHGTRRSWRHGSQKVRHPPVTKMVRGRRKMDRFRGNTCESKQQADSTTEYIAGLIQKVVSQSWKWRIAQPLDDRKRPA
jgi:hypothetical protein